MAKRVVVASKRIQPGRVSRKKIVLPNRPAVRLGLPFGKGTWIVQYKDVSIITAGKPGNLGGYDWVTGTNSPLNDRIVYDLHGGKKFSISGAELLRLHSLPKYVGENGYISFGKSDPPMKGAGGKSIGIISVLTPLEARAQGNGKILFQRLEEYAKMSGASCIWGIFLRKNRALNGMLEKMGWEEPEALEPWVPAGDGKLVLAKKIL
jgi:GNAT superfamily N-acetyltransferase